jgi:hypothetical protein
VIEVTIKVDDLNGKCIAIRLDDPDDWNGELTKDMLYDVYQKLRELLSD